MSGRIISYFDFKKNITNNCLRLVYTLLQIFSMILALPICNILQGGGEFLFFSPELFLYLNVRMVGILIMFAIYCFVLLFIYPVFILLDKRRYTQKK